MKYATLVIALFLIFSTGVRAGVDEDLANNFKKVACIDHWEYNKSVFKIYFNPLLCKEKDVTVALLGVRYMFESNKVKISKQIEIYNNFGKKLESFPFKKIPTLITE